MKLPSALNMADSTFLGGKRIFAFVKKKNSEFKVVSKCFLSPLWRRYVAENDRH